MSSPSASGWDHGPLTLLTRHVGEAGYCSALIYYYQADSSVLIQWMFSLTTELLTARKLTWPELTVLLVMFACYFVYVDELQLQRRSGGGWRGLQPAGHSCSPPPATSSANHHHRLRGWETSQVKWRGLRVRARFACHCVTVLSLYLSSQARLGIALQDYLQPSADINADAELRHFVLN